MSDETCTDYSSMFGAEKDAAVEEPVVDDTIYEVVEEPVEGNVDEPVVEEVDALDSTDTHVKVNIDKIAKLRLRAEPSGNCEIIDSLPNETKLVVISDEDPDWLFVETKDDPPKRGYVKKAFVSATV
jgi:hypothetical protein